MKSKLQLKKIIYRVFPRIPIFNLYIGRWLYSKRLEFSRHQTIEKFKTKKDFLVNVGCGSNGYDGWINIDYSLYEGVNCTFDCRKELPFQDASVKGIFTEHFFEHLDYENEAKEFLADCFRVLVPGGVIRIIVPDAEKFLYGYCSPDWELLSSIRPLSEDHKDFHLDIKYKTKMELINVVFRQFGEHKFAYDYETLYFSLKEAGFGKVEKMEFGKSNMPELIIDLKVRESESLYVEAIKVV